MCGLGLPFTSEATGGLPSHMRLQAQSRWELLHFFLAVSPFFVNDPFDRPLDSIFAQNSFFDVYLVLTGHGFRFLVFMGHLALCQGRSAPQLSPKG